MLNVRDSLNPSQAIDLLSSRVLNVVPHIRICPYTGPGLKNSLLQAASQGRTPLLKKLSGSLELASPEILAGAAVKLEELRAELSSPQLEAIFTRIAGSQDSKLRSLDGWQVSGISGVDVSMVSSAVFAGALSRLESVYLGLYTRVTAGQLEALFTVLTSHQAEAGEPKLKELGLMLCGMDFSSVSSELLVRAIQRLEKVEFFYARMTVEQITAVRTMVKENRQGRLKNVKIYFSSVSVSPVLIREARMNHAVKIELVRLKY